MIALWALIKFIILIQIGYSYKELSWAHLNDNSKETVCKRNMYDPNLAWGFHSILAIIHGTNSHFKEKGGKKTHLIRLKEM